MIRRLNFPGGLQTENAEQYRALVEALGGDDNAGIRLWWDTGTNCKKKFLQYMLLQRMVLGKDSHALVKLCVLVILNERGAGTQAFLVASGGDQ